MSASTLTHRFRTFAHQHDDLPAFHATYLVGTFLAAAVFNLGFFGLLIVLHMVLDVIKYRDFLGYSVTKTIRGVFVESLVDITLFFVALSAALYLHHEFGLAALSGLDRAGITLLRGFATIIPKMQILERFLGVIEGLHYHFSKPHRAVDKPFTASQYLSIFFLTISIALVLYSPIRFAHAHSELTQLLQHELVPGVL